MRPKNKFVLSRAFSLVNLSQINKLNMTSITKYNTHKIKKKSKRQQKEEYLAHDKEIKGSCGRGGYLSGKSLCFEYILLNCN